MKKIFVLCLLVLWNFISYSQEKKLTIEEAVLGRSQFNPEDFNNLKWRTNSQYTYTKTWTELTQSDINNPAEISILDIKKVNTALEKARLPKINYFIDYEWIDENQIRIQNENCIFSYLIDENKIVYSILPDENAENLSFCNINKSLAFSIANNLFIKDTSNKAIQITNDLNPGIINGDANVHRHEFGIDKGIFWSPSGNYLAFYRKDQTMVADYPLVDITTRIATLKNDKYPMAGETSEQVALGVYNLKSGKTVFMKTSGSRDHYLTCISWDPSEKFIYTAELNREQNEMKLNQYDAISGDFIQTLFEEKNQKYVEPEHSLYFLKNKPNQFIWQSERDGFNHLYLYDNTGKLIKQVTKGNYVITDLIGLDQKEENLFAMSTMDSPLENNLYKYSLKDGRTTRLTVDKGVHEISISPDYKYFTDKYSNTSNPGTIKLTEISGKPVRDILIAKNPLVNFKLGEMRIGKLTAADNKTELYYRMIKPVDFDPSKKYPVIVYVYGGPHAQLVTESWLGGTGLWDYYMAQKGYILFTLDNRGSANRGLEFENVIHRQCGQEEMKDQMKGVEFLKSLPYVDQNRIGVDGWSYGGFMSISLMVNYPETFKVGCAGGPVIDWKYYEVMYGERYMDTPQENPEGFAKTSLISRTKDLKGRLLVIHGGMDNTVVWQNSLNFLNSCIENSAMVDYFVYPTHEHNVRGKDRLHLMKKITQYFDDFL